jgi:hypothetical protein
MLKQPTTLSSNFITCRLQGRTGNMMFQIANAYAQSIKYNRQFTVPSNESSSNHLEKTLFRKLDFNIKLSDQVIGTKYRNLPFHFSTDTEPETTTPTAYQGWVQSEKYFIDYSEHIKDLFSYPKEFLTKVLDYYPFFQDKTVAAISVRRGDYLTFPTRHPVVSKEYLDEAYKKLPYHDVLLVMSDDPQWCKDNLSYTNMVISNNNMFWDAEGLWLLSLCDHFIIYNSTFSWWGAYLSRSTNKKVIAPECWFGPDIDSITSDIYCHGWEVVPSKWDNGYIIPIL